LLAKLIDLDVISDAWLTYMCFNVMFSIAMFM
jgi:hypothetical protein